VVRIDDLRPDHPFDQIGHVGAAAVFVHAVDGGLRDVEIDRLRAVHRVGADHRMDDRRAEFLDILRSGVAVVDIEGVDRAYCFEDKCWSWKPSARWSANACGKACGVAASSGRLRSTLETSAAIEAVSGVTVISGMAVHIAADWSARV